LFLLFHSIHSLSLSFSPVGLEETKKEGKSKEKKMKKKNHFGTCPFMHVTLVSLSFSKMATKEREETRCFKFFFIIIFYGTPRKREAHLFFLLF